ncbi:MAG: ABC transporter substrate-binding protein [Stackebrandtia sp.]
MRLRRLLAALAALTVGVTLAGCGAGDDGRGTVTVWTYPVIADPEADREFWDRTAAAFRDAHPDLDVTVVSQPWENRDASLSAALLAGKGPDVAYLISDQVGRYYAQDVLAPIEDYLSEETLSGYRDNALASMSVDGRPYAAPMIMSAFVGSCDKRILDETGITPPKTWQDVLDIGPKLKDAGYYTTYYQGDLKSTLNMNFYQFVWQAGGSVFSADGKSLAVDGEEGVAALTFLKELVDSRFVDRSALTQAYQPDQSPMARGEVACVYNLAPNDVEKAMGGREHIEVTPPLTGAVQAAFGAVGGYAVFRDARDPEAARAWMTHLSSPDVIADYNKTAGYFSPHEAVADLYADDPVFGAAEQYLDVTVPGEPHPRAREVQELIGPQVQAALLGVKTPEAALADAAAQADPLLRD